jgi:hypothetical protein
MKLSYSLLLSLLVSSCPIILETAVKLELTSPLLIWAYVAMLREVRSTSRMLLKLGIMIASLASACCALK